MELWVIYRPLPLVTQHTGSFLIISYELSLFPPADHGVADLWRKIEKGAGFGLLLA
jgi:hypothetical protein